MAVSQIQKLHTGLLINASDFDVAECIVTCVTSTERGTHLDLKGALDAYIADHDVLSHKQARVVNVMLDRLMPLCIGVPAVLELARVLML